MPDTPLVRDEILAWLREEDSARLEQLWAWADQTRAAWVGPDVHLRALLEISNHCVRHCGYCGLRGLNRSVGRYRMNAESIVSAARSAADLGYGTVVLQAGEDPMLTTERVAQIVRHIKRSTSLAVTLSLGERRAAELLAWRNAGADRYLLRFETSDRDLYRLIHPDAGSRRSDRVAILRSLKQMGYEVGSGVMVGIPGQTYASLADDILLFRQLDLDMIGVGPYLPHPQTPLGQGQWRREIAEHEQVPSTELMTYKVVALTRLLRPDANIPATTALATINRINGRELALMRGANVVMPNFTPHQYRAKYEIYPDKACVGETEAACDGCLRGRIASIGRTVGVGPGSRRQAQASCLSEQSEPWGGLR